MAANEVGAAGSGSALRATVPGEVLPGSERIGRAAGCCGAEMLDGREDASGARAAGARFACPTGAVRSVADMTPRWVSDISLTREATGDPAGRRGGIEGVAGCRA